MAEIVGTITNLSDFLSKTQVCLSVKPNDPQQQIICLEADRKYSIPAFQREVRWDDNNLKMLLYDLSRSSKFLGNIILTIKSDHTCEIIDGQQRTTVLMLIVSCIKKKFGTKISTPDLCPLRNEGFTGFQTLLEKAFDQEAITSDDWNAILKSDDYLQLPRIQKLWNTISSSELLADRHKAQGLLDNLCKSEFNIIASYSNDVNTSIQYFLDVNLKGIAYCFLGTLFEDSELEFPFIIDSPTGKMDFEKRQAVADIIPLVFNQMIAFVQSAEVERFADRFYANPDSQYLTVVASPQDQAVVVYEGIDFFDSYQREHKGDEK